MHRFIRFSYKNNFFFILRSRYFRGKRFFGDFEIHVEQADIKDLTVTASVEKGCTVSMAVLSPSGSRVLRSFKPDFFLCRQAIKDAGKDYRNVLLGLNIGGVPSINSLNSLYNFQVCTIVYPQAKHRVWKSTTDNKIFRFYRLKKKLKTFKETVDSDVDVVNAENNISLISGANSNSKCFKNIFAYLLL